MRRYILWAIRSQALGFWSRLYLSGVHWSPSLDEVWKDGARQRDIFPLQQHHCGDARIAAGSVTLTILFPPQGIYSWDVSRALRLWNDLFSDFSSPVISVSLILVVRVAVHILLFRVELLWPHSSLQDKLLLSKTKQTSHLFFGSRYI